MASLEVLLKDPSVCASLNLAWRESQPGPSSGHEEGGFIVEEPTGSVRVIRWPQGAGNTITVPAHPECRVEGVEIIASFHTHPNTGSGYVQEPSETDKRAMRDDPDLKSHRFVGELVISAALIYCITPSGSVIELGETEKILAGA
jgi:Prokaryotic homologs of the JAB domain